MPRYLVRECGMSGRNKTASPLPENRFFAVDAQSHDAFGYYDNFVEVVLFGFAARFSCQIKLHRTGARIVFVKIVHNYILSQNANFVQRRAAFFVFTHKKTKPRAYLYFYRARLTLTKPRKCAKIQ